ncbi:MAG: 2-hydroxyacid dehydrogenase [Spirochaetes bacterium]|nr:2-hydroxyacid dehydrogenase [Spirochaetota bacterium]
MKIGFAMPLDGEWKKGIAGLAARRTGDEFVADSDRTLAEIRTMDAIVAYPLARRYFEEAERLKAVFVPFVGVNHLPADLLIGRGIQAYNCHGNAESVAERALALTLAGFGRIIEFHNDMKAGKWHGFWVGHGLEDFWHSIWGLRCAILGSGAIGTRLARILKAFDCETVGFRRRTDAALPPYFDSVTTDIAEAVKGAAIVFVTLPLTDSTRGLVSRELLMTMKDAFLVNVGRGEIVDEEGLYAALRDGVLRGAGIDTWYNYPERGSDTGFPSRFPIHELPNVVLSPHVAGSTHEAVAKNVEEILDNLETWLRTGSCDARVDLREMY